MNRKLVSATAVLALLAGAEPALAQAGEPPAGGAALDQVIGGTVASLLLTALLLWLGLGHRSGRLRALARAAAAAERATTLPGWAALPSLLSGLSLVVALIGFLWDVSIHIDNGRDTGPFANPSHFLILAGLFGLFAAGWFACVLPLQRPSASAVRVLGDWYAPIGGVLLVAASTYALIGFPLDDIWHRLFGQDVTLWGPTHLMMISGAGISLLALAALLVEGERARGGSEQELPMRLWMRRVGLAGGLLMGLSVFQGEFDFGVPQFRLVFGPVLVMLAAGVGLVSLRIWLGRGAALGAVAFFLLVRGLVSVIVGPILGQSTPHFPLYIGEALAVELAFALLPRASALRAGLVSGIAIGTIGLATEWAWSHVWMPIPWSAELAPEGIAYGLAAALAGSLVGAWIGERLASDRLPRTREARVGAVVGAVAMLALVGWLLYKPPVEGVSVTVTLEPAPGERDGRWVYPHVAFDPPDAPEGAEALNVTAWQGGGFVLEKLVRSGDGTYTTEQPIPVYGNWKALIRMSRGNTMSAAPIYLPEDPAIPATEVPALPRFERTMVADHKILQREQKEGVPAWLTVFGYLTVGGLALGICLIFAWGLHRLALGTRPTTPGPPGQSAPRARAPVGAGA
jgi:uncharacterized membrane protein YeaQ/YmgE (transglycosylase-associated protein family)